MNEGIHFPASIKCEISQSKTHFWVSWWNLEIEGRVKSEIEDVAWVREIVRNVQAFN